MGSGAGRGLRVEFLEQPHPTPPSHARVPVASRLPACPPPAAGSCQLDLQLVFEEVAGISQAFLYPINAMRNRALAAARTNVVALMDVDFCPPTELSQLALEASQYAELHTVTEAGAAVVLPAFELVEGAGGAAGLAKRAEQVLMWGKGAATAALAQKSMIPFHSKRYPQGNRATNSTRWSHADVPYNVAYEEVMCVFVGGGGVMALWRCGGMC